ncbi:MAG: thioesterase family protein [Nocardioides sp.]|uniref:thioesterase family protein n=1 Tax=Nocardioides sp. TaxID=35761 RepID=UPI0039E5380D
MRALPTYDQVLTLPSASRLAVPPEYGDLNGHMNVRNYLGIYDDAEWEIFGAMGAGAEEAAAGQGGVFALEQTIIYRREVLVGDEVSTHMRLVARRKSLLHIVSYLANHTRQEIAGSMEALEGFVAYDTRRLSPWPGRTAVALDAEIARCNTLDWQPELAGAINL